MGISTNSIQSELTPMSGGIHLPAFLQGDSKESHKPSAPAHAERSFIMVKPDGVQRNLVGKIIGRFEDRGFKIVAIKMVHATPAHLEKRMSHSSG